MSEIQKVIKYVAMGFAIFLAVSIISGIITAVVHVTGYFSDNGGETVDIVKEFDSDSVRDIRIEMKAGELKVKEGSGDKIYVEVANAREDFEVNLSSGGNLVIKDKKEFFRFISFDGRKTVVTVSLPRDFVAERMNIEAGAGGIKISDVRANKLSIDLGAGNTDIRNIRVDKLDMNAGAGNIYGTNLYAEDVDIDGGVGNITLEEVEFYNTDVDSGVGNVEIAGLLYGKNEFDGGVGETRLRIANSSDAYRVRVEKGLGSIRINGEKYSNVNWNNTTAENSIFAKGGVGNINIEFER